MDSARKIAKEALRAANICEVVDEDVKVNRLQEYITVTAVSGVYTDYANGRPIQRRENIDVDYFGITSDMIDERMQQIEAALVAAGFRVVSLPLDLGYDQEEQYFGASAEFALYRSLK